MKKRVHKNQIVITTLAVLIAVAGYVTYDKKGADIKDAETVANMNQGAVSDQADKDYETGEDLDITSSKEDLADASTEDVENPGETVLTSVTSGDSDGYCGERVQCRNDAGGKRVYGCGCQYE